MADKELTLTVSTIFSIGSNETSTGGRVIMGPIVNGTLQSEPGFETFINATISNADWPTIDPDGLHQRPDLRGLVTTDDGEYLQILATGIQTIIPELNQIITGEKGLNLPFGTFQSVIPVSFVTGTPKYKNIQDSVFIGSETAKSLGGGAFLAGLKISKVYSAKTNVTL
ncbi:MAG: hypothetical protein LQ349_005313 [Xanthoria aureola]|nr:MAG: hypothetical protein LQ349_005313 [Xanthoria aureola]